MTDRETARSLKLLCGKSHRLVNESLVDVRKPGVVHDFTTGAKVAKKYSRIWSCASELHDLAAVSLGIEVVRQ